MKICNERLMQYQDLWQIGMYKQAGKWIYNMDEGFPPLTFKTTKGALEFARNCSSD